MAEIGDTGWFFFIVGICVMLVLSIVVFALITRQSDSRKKKLIWNVSCLLMPVAFAVLIWGAGAHWVFVIGVSLLVSFASLRNIVLIDFCDGCGKMLKGRDRKESGLLCYDCYRNENSREADGGRSRFP